MVGFILSLYLITFAWSTIRVADLTIFDVLTPPMLIFLWFNFQQGVSQVTKSRFSQILMLSTLCLMLGVVTSTPFATDPVASVTRGIIIGTSLALTTFNMIVIAGTGALKPIQIARAMLVSCVVHSCVTILQGQFGLLQALNHAEDKWQDWSRAPGLAEHPIEAGLTSGFGIILAIYLLLQLRERKWETPLALGGLVLSALAMLYSASMTALLATLASIPVLFFLSGKRTLLYSYIGAGLIGGSAVVIAIQGTQLGTRVDDLLANGSSYNTVEARNDQYRIVIGELTFTRTVLGGGFDPHTLPNDLDVHNGILASVYHFGLFGLLSQMLLVLYAARAVFVSRDPFIKGCFGGLMVIFLCGYLTGPTLSRRSIWVPILTFSAIASATQFGASRKGPLPRPPLQPRMGGRRMPPA